ncbi:transcriptional regulator, GntR family [Jatrophihabitans endophyticus]|uniref:Transcriptional regulator, GntR family n=1 Tax=Jatrophihabitans endophyticus TaxID=1206085 RepID=A0A1M5S0T2_9ACTN|nr:GntR family transcriptional regulator [Jatrophihabitans endophyticus]SHH32049.1 transcriptional regulator, GntR family [Jatrophihabitans endophyticus]
MVIERETYAQAAYRAIQRMVVEGELAPGSKVVVRPLCELLDLSPTPIKTALAALERDGFLVATPHRGYRVPQPTWADMREIYELREVLDGIAARNAAGLERPEEFVAATLKPLYERQQAAAEGADLVAYSDIDLEFHQAIGHASENSRLVRVMENLGGQFRFASGSSARVPGRVHTAMREHAVIMRAVAAGDAERAEREARAHVRKSAAAFDKSVRANGVRSR